LRKRKKEKEVCLLLISGSEKRDRGGHTRRLPSVPGEKVQKGVRRQDNGVAGDVTPGGVCVNIFVNKKEQKYLQDEKIYQVKV